jgi:hypothetical protein
MKYRDWYPLASKNGITGAYAFLIKKGYHEEVECIKRVGYNTNARRLMVTGLLFEKNLLDQFLNSIWTQGTSSHRRQRMKIWYRRYSKRADLRSKCWKAS